MADNSAVGPSGANLNPARGTLPAVFLAILIGFIGIIGITFFVHWYVVEIFQNVHPSNSQLIIHALPAVVFFMLFLLVAVLNPLLHRFLPALALGYREVVIVLSLWLVTGVICFINLTLPVLGTIGLMNTPVVITGNSKTLKLADYYNLRCFLFYTDAGNEFYKGLGDGTRHILPFAPAPELKTGEVRELLGVVSDIEDPNKPLSKFLLSGFSPEAQSLLGAYAAAAKAEGKNLAGELNRVIAGPAFYSDALFEGLTIADETRRKARANPAGAPLAAVNRLLLGESFPSLIAKSAEGGPTQLAPEDLKGLVAVARKLTGANLPLTQYLMKAFSDDGRKALTEFVGQSLKVENSVQAEFNKAIDGPNLYAPDRFTREMVTGDTQRIINRLVLNQAYADDLVKPPMPIPWDFFDREIKDSAQFAGKLRDAKDPGSKYLLSLQTPENRVLIEKYFATAEQLKISSDPKVIARANIEGRRALEDAVIGDYNDMLRGACIYDKDRFAGFELTEETRTGVSKALAGDALIRLNRALIEETHTGELSTAAPGAPVLLRVEDFKDLPAFAIATRAGTKPLDAYLYGRLSAKTRATLERYEQLASLADLSASLSKALVDGLNKALTDTVLLGHPAFPSAVLSSANQRLMNRLLLQQGFTGKIAGLPRSVPWAMWWQPLTFWIPLMLVFIVMSASLVRIMHRQWSRHELLTYPLADISDSFLRRFEGRAFPAAFYDKVFWYGFALIGFIYLVNGLQVWFPKMIRIPLEYSHTEMVKEFPFLSRYCGGESYAFFRAWIYPFIVCIAVLLPTEISLTCWLGWGLMVVGTGVYFFVAGEQITLVEVDQIHYGMYVAMLAVILIIGRREYYSIVRRALTFRRTDDEWVRRAANACRVFILAFIVFAWLLTVLGFDWVIAVVYTGVFSLVILLIARMTAEIGDPWLMNFMDVTSLMPYRMLGAPTLGPKGLVNMAVLRSAMDNYGFPSNSIAAQETTINKLREKHGGWFSKAGFNLVLGIGVCLALAGTIFFSLWDNYSYGVTQKEKAYGQAELNDISTVLTPILRMKSEGKLARADEAAGLSKLQFFQFESKFWRFFAYGAVLVGVCALLRLRFSWWPFHPLPLLFFNTWAMSRLYMPIFLGWLIKLALLKIWGGKIFARAKPFFIGVIVGQIVVAGVWITVNVIYYLMYNTLPGDVLHWKLHIFI